RPGGGARDVRPARRRGEPAHRAGGGDGALAGLARGRERAGPDRGHRPGVGGVPGGGGGRDPQAGDAAARHRRGLDRRPGPDPHHRLPGDQDRLASQGRLTARSAPGTGGVAAGPWGVRGRRRLRGAAKVWAQSHYYDSAPEVTVPDESRVGESLDADATADAPESDQDEAIEKVSAQEEAPATRSEATDEFWEEVGVDPIKLALPRDVVG